MIVDQALTVYIDFKSPYAYLAIEPTRRLATELGITVNWLPFVLDIPSYLGAAKLGNSGRVVEQSRSEEQWSGVKYAYYDCRRYANLRNLTIRGTVKIWDTHLAAVGMLWAKKQGDDILHAYMDGVFEPFWKRELDVEDIDVIVGVLALCGSDVSGFKTFARGPGAEENRQLQMDAFDNGIFGVPSYVLGESVYFGREHIPRLRWQMAGQKGTAPDIAYEMAPDIIVAAAPDRLLDVGISLGEAETHLVIEAVQTMARELDLLVRWFELPYRKTATDPSSTDESRGSRHRRYRTLSTERDRQRYASTESLNSSDIGRATRQLLDEQSIELVAERAVSAGFTRSPVFVVGEERYIGRQHLPLIRARFEKLEESN